MQNRFIRSIVTVNKTAFSFLFGCLTCVNNPHTFYITVSLAVKIEANTR